MTNTLKQITRSRSDLVFDAPFFGAIALRLRMKALIDDPHLTTFGVDGYTIFYNPAFVETLSQKETTAVIAHEVLHVAMLHHTRMGNRHPELWNVACDYAINPIVKKNGFTLPASALLDSKYYHMSAEKIYADLLQGKTPEEALGDILGENGTGQKAFDKILKPPKDKQTTAEQDAKALANTGIVAAKTAGNMPGGMEDIISACHAPQINWQDRLRELLSRKARGDQVWHKPNKRLLDTLYLPYFEEIPTGDLIMAIDSSQSVSNKELNIYASEIQEIMIDNSIEKLTVLWIDTQVQRVQYFEMHEDIILQVKGRGGTCFEPAFDWITEHGEVPDCLLYFTDGEASWPNDPPPYPVIWCITNDNIQAPWGDTINLKF